MRIKAGSKTCRLISLEYWDLLLVAGLCLAPMTGLRIWKIGPGEILCMLWAIKHLFTHIIRVSDTLIFFSLFIMEMAIGSLIGYVIAPNELRVTDLLTWVYLGIISVLTYEGLSSNSVKYNESLLYTLARVAVIWNFFLFLYSETVSKRIFGAPLWYANARFSGGGTNPHQIAVLLCGICFVFLRKIVNKERIIINFCYFAISIYLMLQTASSTGVLSIVLGIGITICFLVIDLFPYNRAAAFIILAVFFLILLLLWGSLFYDSFLIWVANDPNGLGRLNIFSSFPITFKKSPLFGLGPGVHGLDGRIEYHNTYIEILAATGLIGGLVFTIYSMRLMKRVISIDWSLFPIIISMYAYGFAGFSMRRLVYWGIVSFVTVISEQLIITNEIRNNSFSE